MPNRLLIIPTKKCDLRCAHCLRDNFKGDAMPVEMLDRFVSEIKSRNPSIHFSMTGGEPTIHPQFDEYLQVYVNHKSKFSIVSNGISVPGREAVIKHKKNCLRVAVSFDSPVAEINDIVRGKGSFEKAIETVRAYNINNVPFTMKYVMHDDNADSMLECFDLALEVSKDNPKNPPKIVIATLHSSVKTASVPGRLKSLAKGKDLSTGDKVSEVFQKLDRLRKLPKYSSLSTHLVSRHVNGYKLPKADWKKEACGNVQNYETKPEEHIVLLPDGKVSYCCDLYDLDYDHSRYQNAGANDPVNHVIGDYSIETLDTILLRKQSQTQYLIDRRYKDHDLGLLVNERANVCDNCKFYHHQPKQDGSKKFITVPIVQLKQIS